MVVLRMNNLQNGEIDLSEVRRADLSKKEVHELNLVPGDILFNRTNSRNRQKFLGKHRLEPTSLYLE